MKTTVHSSRRALGACLGMSLAALLVACGDPVPRTEILVIIDADQAVRAESVKLRVVVRGGRGETMGGLDDRFYRELDVTPTVGWPVQIGVIPLDGDVGRIFEIEVAGVDATRREVTLVRARTGFAAGRTLVLRLQLEDACRGVVCTDRQTCTGGVCADVAVTPVADLPPYDPGTLLPDGGMPMPTVCEIDADCDDGVFCNGRERCLDLLCASGTRVVCDDGVACTRDVCRVNACVGEPDDTMCMAGPGGRCAGAQGCQYDVCDATTCATSADACETANCSDALCVRTSTCATGESCCSGTCAPLGCDDGNDCTLDACGATGCTHTARMGAACNDGDACTASDTCGSGGVCAGRPRSCDDMNPCTDDSCLAGAGCVNTQNAIPCSDGNACTLGDVCASGACFPGPACDDGIACTTDRCDGTGCVFAPNSALCTASAGGVCDPATGCQYGTCSPATCVAADACDTAVCMGATCMHTRVTCPSDMNSCTDELCDAAAGGCRSVNNTTPCDDANVCTVGDLCSGGACTGTPNPCNDGNPCTGTACTPGVGCTYAVAIGAVCGPSDACEQYTCDAAGGCPVTRTTCFGGLDECITPYCDPVLGCQMMLQDGNSCCDGGFLGTCDRGACRISAEPPWC